MTEAAVGIHRAMLAILREMESIPKDRSVQEPGGRTYAYRGVDDAMAALKPLLAKHGVYPVPVVTETTRWQTQYRSGTTAFGVSLRVTYRFYAEDGSSVEAVVQGDGLDSGDKGVYKALSGAFKYALFQTFCIPTDEPKDPEAGEQPDPVAKAKYRVHPGAVTPSPRPAAAQAGPPGADFVLKFGKYKGKPISQVEAGYLDWLVEQKKDDLDNPAKAKHYDRNKHELAVYQAELRRRGKAPPEPPPAPTEEEEAEAPDPQGDDELPHLDDMPF